MNSGGKSLSAGGEALNNGGTSASGGEIGSGGAETGGGPTGAGGSAGAPARPPPHILLLTKTAGFRHTSISVGVTAVQKLCEERGWSVITTEETTAFSDEALADFDALFFLNTTGDILASAEEGAFERFIESGRGFIGVHAATDTEPDWPFYRELLGAHFSSHPAIQEATIRVEDPGHPATDGLTDPWTRTDEWYNFDRNPRNTAQVLLGLEETSYAGGTMGSDHPIAWTREIAESRLFYTALGHTEESYSDSLFLAHLRGGMAWVLGDAE